MPSDTYTQYGYTARKFTGAELKELGLNADTYYDEWEGAVVDCRVTTNSHGPAVAVTFEYDAKYWQVIIGFCHEDWDNNDLRGGRGNYEACEVEPYPTTAYRRKRT